jgi:hypothetical protein
MKKVCLILTLLLTISSLVSGQNERKTKVYLGGGIALPQGPDDFKNYFNIGLVTGGGIGFSLSQNATLVLSFGYGSFGADEAKFKSYFETITNLGFGLYGVSGGNFSNFSVTSTSGLQLEGRINLRLISSPNPVLPYLYGGLGYSSFTQPEITYTYNIPSQWIGYYTYVPAQTLSGTKKFGEDESAFSTSVGLGFEFPFSSSISLLLESGYTIAFTKDENTSFIPFKANISIGF